jgi:hypothetical protein
MMMSDVDLGSNHLKLVGDHGSLPSVTLFSTILLVVGIYHLYYPEEQCRAPRNGGSFTY